MKALRADPHHLLEHYEALRREATSTDVATGRGHGLALFLARGMRAWLDALSALVAPTAPAAHARTESPPDRLPVVAPSIRADLTAVLAGMVLACTREKGVEA